VVQVSGGTLARKKQRRPANQRQIQICGKIGSTQFLEQGLTALLFFSHSIIAIADHVIGKSD
jgi:hypothetical protein